MKLNLLQVREEQFYSSLNFLNKFKCLIEVYLSKLDNLYSLGLIHLELNKLYKNSTSISRILKSSKPYLIYNFLFYIFPICYAL